jgi:phage/plasmid-like protein (TIGR03299 family)
VDDYRVTRRMTDNAILGVVRKNYHPIQNRDAFRMFDNVVGPGKACFHTAGSLMGGSKVFLLAKLPDVIPVGKGIGKTVDDVEKYLLLANSHDGTRPLQMLFTPVRVVCANTLAVALNRKPKRDEETDDAPWDYNAPRVTVRHTAKAKLALKEAERTMKRALEYYKEFGDFANFLYRAKVNSAQVTNVVGLVFPPNKKKEVTPTIAEHRNNVIQLFTEGKGHDAPGVRGSAWALFNAFTEYADHGYAARNAKDDEDRSYSVLMGGAKGLKNRATREIADLLAA